MLPKTVSIVVQCANLSAVSIDLEANTHEQSDGEEREPGLGEGSDRVRKDGAMYLITGQFQHNTCLSSRLSALSLIYCLCLCA